MKISTLPFLFFIALAAYVFGYHALADFDIWWHLGLGNWMLSHGKIPAVDYFTWTRLGQPMINAEWGAELLFALVYQSLGLGGLYLIQFICTYLILLVVGLTTRLLSEQNWTAYPAVLLAGTLMSFRIVVRPHLISILLLALLILLLSAHGKHRINDKQLGWWLVPLYLVWVNVHGSFVLGLGLFGLYWFGSSLQKSIRDKKICIQAQLFFFCVLSFLVMLINPYFHKAYLLSIEHLQLVNIMKYTMEFMPPYVGSFVLTLPAQFYFVSLFVIIIAVIWRRRQVSWGLFLVGLALSYVSMKHSRFISIYSCWAVPFFFGLMADKKIGVQWQRLLIILCWLYFGWVGVRGVLPMEWSGHGIELGTEIKNPMFKPATSLVRFLKTNHLPETNPRLYNSMRLGAYLILEKIPVFLDGRAYVYGDEYFLNYTGKIQSAKYFVEYERQWQWTMLLLAPEEVAQFAQVHDYLLNNPDWHLVYLDETAIVYLKNTAENQTVIDHYTITSSPLSP